MSQLVTSLPTLRLMTPTQARWLVIGMHLPFIVFAILLGTNGLGLYPSGYVWLLPLGLALGSIQLRHSLAAADGRRPRYWGWTLLLIVILAYAPLLHDGDDFVLRWRTPAWFVVASLAMLLPTRYATGAILANAVGWSAWVVLGLGDGLNAAQLAWQLVYNNTIMLTGGIGLYAACRFALTISQLRETRATLAGVAIGRERLRISRDLHDTLGQTLTAVSLKGDLAIGLLERDQQASARKEIESLVSVARTALHDLREVAHRELPVTLAEEIERAEGLLAAAGIETRIQNSAEETPPPVDELLGWGLREGITNVLRHSTATVCSINIQRGDGRVSLEIENDGAGPMSTGGRGLVGLADRAQALYGQAMGQVIGSGRFLLKVEVPEAAS